MYALKNLGVYVGYFFLLIGSVLFWESKSMSYYSQYGPGPGMMPLWTSIFLIAFSLVYLLVNSKKDIYQISEVLPKGKGLVNILVSIGSCILFMIVAPYAGFVIGCTLMLFLLLIRGYKWYWSLGLALVITIAVYVIFVILLQVPLPVNDFGW